MVKRFFPWPLYLVLYFVISFPVFAEAATVEFFTPQGTLKKVQQVKARFSDQMVAFGDPRLSNPFTIECPEKGSGRWVDGKNWSYDFDKDLPSGVSCTFTLKRGIKTFSGKSMTGKAVFRFNTGGPAVIMTQPYEGDEKSMSNNVLSSLSTVILMRRRCQKVFTVPLKGSMNVLEYGL